MRVRKFWNSTDGGVAVGFGLSTIVVLATAGAAIDYSRWHHTQQQTQIALDAAVLAAGRSLQLNGDFEAASAIGQSFFNDQVQNRLPVASSSVAFALADNNSALIGTAQATVETPLMGLANVNELEINATAKAAFSTGGGSGGGGSDLEISLMLDVTGSMCNDGEGPCTSSSKLDALKTAATDLINVVIKDDSAQDVRVALVPFSTRIRVGLEGTSQAADFMETLTNLPQKWSGWYNICTNSTGGGESEGGGDWQCHAYNAEHVENWEIMPCVTDRNGPAKLTDAMPGPNAWLNAHDGGRFPQSWSSYDTPIAAGDGLGQQNSDPAGHWNYVDENDVYCSDVAQANMIMPLTSDKEMLEARLAGLEAYGSTAGALGTAWSWYMLSPNWGAVFSSGSQPGSYSDLTSTNAAGLPKLRKIAVLLTDGQYNTTRGWKDQDPVAVSNDAKALCANMKAAGIEVFTVGFDLDSLPAADRARAIDTLQSCGSDIDHFYNTLDTAQLQQAFTAIALQLSQLYLAQ